MQNLFDVMEFEVKHYVKHYQNDFYEHDKNYIFKHGTGKYIWMVRESGTELYLLKDLQYLEASCRESCKYWMPSAVRVYMLDVTKVGKKHVYGYMIGLAKDKLQYLLDNAKPMDLKTKIDYLLRHIEQFDDVQEILRALYYGEEQYKTESMVIYNLLNNTRLEYLTKDIILEKVKSIKEAM